MNSIPESLVLPLLHIVFFTKKRMPFLQSAELRSEVYALRPFRANRFIGCFPGLKLRAESCSPFGAKNYFKNTVILAPLGESDQL
jgi:hypothetical protein